MTTFLLKTEPDDYSIDDLQRDRTTVWDGVTNPAACKHMRGARKGDEALIYHTGNQRRVVGLAKITTDPYPDPKSNDARTAKGEIKTPVFDVRYVKKARTPVDLAQIKADKTFEDFDLIRQPRLSAMPVPPKMDKALRNQAGL